MSYFTGICNMPTIRFPSTQCILALACHHNHELQHVDIEGAYLNRILEDDVYMCQHKGFIEKGKEHLVCKLNKGIYGLKQSGRVWHCTLRNKLEKTGFTPGNTDSTIYFGFGKNGSIQLAGWYINNGLLAADSTESMEHMIKDIRGSF